MTAKAIEEAEEDPVVAARARVDQAERALREPEDDDRGEHQQRAGHRVDHERDRRRDAVRAAPDADEDVDRDQHRLEEDVEEQQILRGEDADDRADEEEHEAEVGARRARGRPRRRSRSRRRRRRPSARRARARSRRSRRGSVTPRSPNHARCAPSCSDRRGEVEPDEHDDPEPDLGERDEHGERGRRLARAAAPPRRRARRRAGAR